MYNVESNAEVANVNVWVQIYVDSFACNKFIRLIGAIHLYIHIWHMYRVYK